MQRPKCQHERHLSEVMPITQQVWSVLELPGMGRQPSPHSPPWIQRGQGPGCENSPSGPRSSGQPSVGWPLQPWGSPWDCASWCSFGCKKQLFAQIDDLLGRIGWYFIKPKGEKFSLASEELESGTAKLCMPVAPLPSLTASLPLSPQFSGQFSLLEGALNCPWLLLPTTKCESPSCC